jgi:hypothetical protein
MREYGKVVEAITMIYSETRQAVVLVLAHDAPLLAVTPVTPVTPQKHMVCEEFEERAAIFDHGSGAAGAGGEVLSLMSITRARARGCVFPGAGRTGNTLRAARFDKRLFCHYPRKWPGKHMTGIGP